MFATVKKRVTAAMLLAALAATVFAADVEAATATVKAREAARGELSLGPGKSVPMVRMFFYTLNGVEQAEALCDKMKSKFPRIDGALKATLDSIGKTKLSSARYVVIFGYPEAVNQCRLMTATDSALRGETILSVQRDAKLDFDRKATASLGYMIVELPPSENLVVLRLVTPQGTALLQSHYAGLKERSADTEKMYQAMLEIARQKSGEEMFKLGRWCENQGLLDEACRHYESALALDPLSRAACEAVRRVKVVARLESAPQNSAEFYERAEALVSIARYDEAMEDLANAIKLDPKKDKAYYLLGVCLTDYARFAEAETALNTAISIEPGDARYYSQRAVCRMFLDNAKGGKADMESAEKLDPTDSGLLCLKAGELVAAAMEQSEADKQRKTLSGALDAASRAIEAHPDDYRNYCVRGAIHILLKNPDYAFADATEAFRLNPYHYRVHLVLGKYYLSIDELQKAEAFYTQAVTNFPKLKNVVVERAKFYVLVGDLSAALADFTAAIALDGKDAESYCNRASVHLLRGDADKALPDLDKAVEIKPGNVLYRFERARINYENNDLGAALTDLEAIVDLGAANDSVYYMIGVIYRHKGDTTRALENFRRALAICDDENFRKEIEKQIDDLK